MRKATGASRIVGLQQNKVRRIFIETPKIFEPITQAVKDTSEDLPEEVNPLQYPIRNWMKQIRS